MTYSQQGSPPRRPANTAQQGFYSPQSFYQASTAPAYDHVPGQFDPNASSASLHTAQEHQYTSSQTHLMPDPSLYVHPQQFSPQYSPNQASYPPNTGYDQEKVYSPYGNQPGSYFSPTVVGGFVPPPRGPASYYGQFREKIMQRREKQDIQLTDGHLVLDCPVPQSILTYAKEYGTHGKDEFRNMRYTAVTCDPDQFVKERYTLRPYLYRRKTEIAIVATCYNEGPKLFEDTMTSITKNIQHLQTRDRSKIWGKDAWEKVVVVIVADGRAKIDPRMLKMLGLMGVYQDGIAKDSVAGKPVQGHIFEYTTQVVVGADGSVSGGIAPIQVVFVLKEQNKKKLNSHRWFFNAVCKQLEPNVCILIDVGTRPSGNSIYHLWKAFDKHKTVGGACGEIAVDVGRYGVNLWNPLVAAQNFEYKMSNILDKPTESVFGYISVLPGAFSAYRYKALQGVPLEKYFLGEKMHESQGGQSSADLNMYLAEDRILCFEIVVKQGENWTLKYVKSAKATTDAPDRLDQYILQRRRWLNGSLFAALHASTHFYKIWTSGHNVFRMFWLQIEFIYNLINILFTFTALSNMYLALFFVLQAALGDTNPNPPFGQKYSADVASIIQNLWIVLLFICVICSLGNRPAGAKWIYYGLTVIFALIFGLALFCAGWIIYQAVKDVDIQTWHDIVDLLKTSGFRDIAISLLATYGLYVISSIIHLEPWHLITSFVQYMLLLPATTNILGIYSMSNLSDVSWGNRPEVAAVLGGAKKKGDQDDKVEMSMLSKPEDVDALWIAMRKDLSSPEPEKKEKRSVTQKSEDRLKTFRTNTLLLYIGTNLLIALFFTSKFFLTWIAGVLKTTNGVNPYMSFIFWAVAGLSAFRFLGSTTYLILRLLGQ